MKPTKSRIYCKDSNRLKMLFETEKKAQTFISFNSEEIASESGYSPVRAYFCILCNGWHVTSKKEPFHVKSKTETVLESYKEYKEKRALDRAKNAAIRESQAEALIKYLQSIDTKIRLLEATKENESAMNRKEILTTAWEELKIAKGIPGNNKRKKFLEERLNNLQFFMGPSSGDQS